MTILSHAAPMLWNASMNPHIRGLEVIREGDKDGLGTVARFTLDSGREIGVVALPHHFPSRTGPTWVYLVECQGWTLIDAGSRGALPALEEGLGLLGRKLSDIERLVITHGHQDHDGNSYDTLNASGATLWAHELYFHFLPYTFQTPGLDDDSPLHRTLKATREREQQWYQSASNGAGQSMWHEHSRAYTNGRLNVLQEGLPIHRVQDGDELDGLRFLHTPGHSVDELCITVDGVVLTGDHILPQISPHPTYKQTYPEQLIGAIPEHHQNAADNFGLATYLRSLGKVLAEDVHTTVLPAHRLFNHGKFHVRNLQRAQDIVRHHEKRLGHMMDSVGDGATTTEDVTRAVFPARKLTGGGFFGAVTEVVSHLELLQDVGDILVAADGRIRRNGAEEFHEAVRRMTDHSAL